MSPTKTKGWFEFSTWWNIIRYKCTTTWLLRYPECMDSTRSSRYKCTDAYAIGSPHVGVYTMVIGAVVAAPWNSWTRSWLPPRWKWRRDPTLPFIYIVLYLCIQHYPWDSLYIYMTCKERGKNWMASINKIKKIDVNLVCFSSHSLQGICECEASRKPWLFYVPVIIDKLVSVADTDWPHVCWQPKLARLRHDVRPLVSPGQTAYVKVIKKQFGVHHWIVLVDTVKINIWNIQFGVRMRDIWPPEVLHPWQLVRPDPIGS